MKEKGFTLIELLAVIVVLAIIALIATPMVLNTIDEARKGAAKSSALSYVKAIETKVASSLINNVKYEDKEDYVYDEIKVDIKGTKPTSGMYSLKEGIVTSGVFCINGYEINYSDEKTEVQGKCAEADLKLSGSIKISESSGHYEYPTSGTFEVTENISGGNLSCTSSDEEVAKCSISGTTVTVTPGEKQGSATLTIKSEATSKYKEAQVAHVATTVKGLLSVTAEGYDGTYDGTAHGITVTSNEAIIMYGTSEGDYTLTSSPTYKDAGIYTVYYQVTRTGYTPVTGSKQVVISQAPGSLTLEETSGTVYTNNSTTLFVSGATGTVSCETSDSSVATCSVANGGRRVSVYGASDGTANITVNVASSTNYKATSKTYTVTVVTILASDVELGDYVSMTPTSTSYSIFGTDTGYVNASTGEYIDQTINPSELNLWRVISINSDGTIDMVSEYTSSTNVYFMGQTGYSNFTGTLNMIAKQYENSNYTVDSRYMGYKYGEQTEYMDSSYLTYPALVTSSTIDNGNEWMGGGDIFYQEDCQLVESVLGSVSAYPENSSWDYQGYWLASRYYFYDNPTYFNWGGRYVDPMQYSYDLPPAHILYEYSNVWNSYSVGRAIRPIVTLKAEIKTYTGEGTSDRPWVLS